ncbi:MAG: hypothetical protein ABGX27_08840 [Desulfurobacteriaceae bacterium]
MYDVKEDIEHPEEVQMEKIFPKVDEISNSLIALNPILPPNVRSYFFFDGEKIDEFSKPDHDKEVKEAVYKVLGITLIERAISHVRDILREYNKELAKKSSGRLRELREKYNDVLQEKENLENELKEAKEEREALEANIREVKSRLREIEEIQHLIERRDALESKLTSMELELSKIYSKLRKVINKSFLLIGSISIEEAYEILSKEIKNSADIPKKFLSKLIEKILEEKECICGSALTPEMRRKLIMKKAEIAQMAKSDKTEEIVSSIIAEISGLKSKKETIHSELISLFSEKMRLMDKIQKTYEALDEVDQQLSKNELEDVRKLQGLLEEYTKDLGRYTQKIESIEEKIKEKNEEILFLQKEISKEEKKERETNELTRKKNLAQAVLHQLETLYEKLSFNLRKEIESEATKIFKKLIRKKEFFKRIELSEDYLLKLIDAFEDRESKRELSAGERQVLSLAFILALAKVSKKEAPVVMDTPFGRLDPEHRSNILQEIPYLTRQLVLFVTPSEMTESLKLLIQDKVGKEYELDFNEQEKYTKIVPLER